MIAAIIPARGGSKGIPRKNLLPIGGVPLIARTIRHARGSSFISEVWVTTDNNEIAFVAESECASVFRRSSDTATDTASSDAAILEWMEKHFYPPMETSRNQAMGARWAGARPDPALIVFLQATSPLRRSDDIDKAIAEITRQQADSLFSARRLEGYTWTDNGSVKPNYDQRQPRQQQDAKVIEENGSIYVFKPWVLRQTKNRLGGKIGVYYQHPLDSFQLDSPDDIPLLESLAHARD